MTTSPAVTDVLALPGSAAAVVAWRASGQLQLTVVAKATFAFARDVEMPLVEPQEILRAEVHHGNNPARSIRFSTDLAPYLERADVLFTGAAHAPPGSPAQALTVRLAIFTSQHTSLDKTLEVEDRAGFERLPLVYERARGGIDHPENPVGTGAPSIVDPADRGAARPAGFGPISRTWPLRKRLLGETPRRVLDGAIAEIPPSFDWAYYQAAPLDQQLDGLRGDEWILLDGVYPGAPRLQMRLPGARGRARLHGLSPFGVPEGHPLELGLDTLRIDGDDGRCTLVFRHSMPLPDEAALAAARIVAGVELPGAPLAWPDKLPERRPVAARAVVPAGTAASVRLSSVDLEPDAADVAASPQSTLMTEGTAPRQPALPFLPSHRAAVMVPAPAAPTESFPSGTLAHPASPWTGAAPAPAPVVPPMVAAVPLSALAASNAAADAQTRAPQATGADDPREDPTPSGDVLDLIWFDPKILPRVRKQPAWRDLIDGLEDKSHDPDIDAPGLGDGGTSGEDRRAIFEIVTHGRPLGPAALRAAFKGAIRADRRFVAPLVLLAGELSFPFDELESLKALAAAVSPFASGDAALQGALEGARELLKTPDLAMVTEVVEGATARLREAYGKGKRALPLAELAAQADRALLKLRRYQRRTVLGGPQLRALLRFPEAKEAIPAYLPAALEATLPMYQRFEARILAEAHLTADQHERHPVALRVTALARSSSSEMQDSALDWPSAPG